MHLRTERLILRDWVETDRTPFAALNADPVVMEHFPAPIGEDASNSMIDRLSASFAAGEPSLWAVEEVATGTFLGFTGLLAPSYETHFTPCIEVGWRYARHAWGKGFATEAARAALTHGFDVHGLSEIVSFTTTTNVPSQRVMQRLGMTRDPADDFDHPNVATGSPLCRHVLYRLSAADWRDRDLRPFTPGRNAGIIDR